MEDQISQTLLDRKRLSSDRCLNNAIYRLGDRLNSKGKTVVYGALKDFYAMGEAVYTRFEQENVFSSQSGQLFLSLLSFYVGAEYGIRNLRRNGGHPFGTIDFSEIRAKINRRVLEVYSTSIDSARNVEGMTSDFFEWIMQQGKQQRSSYEEQDFLKFLRDHPISVEGYYFEGFQGITLEQKASQKKYNWEDIAGYEEVKETLEKIGTTIQGIERRLKVAPKEILVPKGMLLYGPPGTGKTHLAMAFCNKFGIPYRTVTGGFRSEYVNKSANELQKIFDEVAKEMKGGEEVYALFIDEFEDLAKRRDLCRNEEDLKLISVLNQNMDGVKAVPGRIVIGNTNLMQNVDPAIVSRMDYKVEVEMPDEKTRRSVFAAIFNKYSNGRETRLEPEFDYSSVSKSMEGFSCRDIDTAIRRILMEKAQQFADEGKEPVVTTKEVLAVSKRKK